MLSVIMLNVVVASVIMPSVMALNVQIKKTQYNIIKCNTALNIMLSDIKTERPIYVHNPKCY